MLIRDRVIQNEKSDKESVQDLWRGKSDWRIMFIKTAITNLVTNVKLHSLSQIFKGRAEVRVDIPAPHHNVISEKNKTKQNETKQNKTKPTMLSMIYYVLIKPSLINGKNANKLLKCI